MRHIKSRIIILESNRKQSEDYKFRIGFLNFHEPAVAHVSHAHEEPRAADDNSVDRDVCRTKEKGKGKEERGG